MATGPNEEVAADDFRDQRDLPQIEARQRTSATCRCASGPRTFTGIISAGRVLTSLLPDARHQVIDPIDSIAGREVTGERVSSEVWAGRFELLWSRSAGRTQCAANPG